MTERLKSYDVNIFSMDWVLTRNVLDAIRDHLGKKHDVILDYGCGEAPLMDLFNYDKYIRADIAATNSPKDITIDANTGHIDLPDCGVDLIICSYALEHMRHPEKAITEFVRLLKPGGVLFVSVPFINRLHEDPYDFYRFTTYFWDISLKDTFKLKKIKSGNLWFTLFSLWYESPIDELNKPKHSFFTRLVRKITRYTVLPLLNLTAFKFDCNKTPAVYCHEIVIGKKV